MKRVLVLGGTGAIGIPAVQDLLANGFEVCVLVRPQPNNEGRVRVTFGKPIPFIEGDVTKEFCGVSREIRRELKDTFDVLLHIAGATEYHSDSERAAITRNVNVNGTQQALNLAAELEIPRFVYISTAYVAGRKAYLSEDDVGSPALMNNPYEATKAEAEDLVRQYSGESLIIRPATVIGDVDTGFLVNPGGYAAFVRGFWIARDMLRRYPDNPFWVPVNPESTLNLVTNEWVVSMMRKAVASNIVGTIHLTHPKPVQMGMLFQNSVGRLGYPITYRKVIADKTALWNDPRWRRLQEGIISSVGYFGPYVTRDTTFGHERVKLVPGYEAPPEVTDHVIEVQLHYMTNFLFGQKSNRLKEVVTA